VSRTRKFLFYPALVRFAFGQYEVEDISFDLREMMLVIDAAGQDPIFMRKDLWSDDPTAIKLGKFWAWAKRMEKRYWKAKHA